MQISITEHENAPTTVYIDGRVTHADTREQIGEVLAKAGVKHDANVDWMNERGRTDRLKASQFLPTASVKKEKRR